MRTYLTNQGLLDDEREGMIAEKAEQVAKQLREGLGVDTSVDPQELFRHVFSNPTPQLRQQSALLADELARDASTADARTEEAGK
jgi:pyruvate dehydrogenase E1 component alpha subunit